MVTCIIDITRLSKHTEKSESSTPLDFSQFNRECGWLWLHLCNFFRKSKICLFGPILAWTNHFWMFWCSCDLSGMMFRSFQALVHISSLRITKVIAILQWKRCKLQGPHLWTKESKFFDFLCKSFIKHSYQTVTAIWTGVELSLDHPVF